jgi:hypothetical protein
MSSSSEMMMYSLIKKMGGEKAFADALVDTARSGEFVRDNIRRGRGPHGEHTCWAAVRIVIEKVEEGE